MVSDNSSLGSDLSELGNAVSGALGLGEDPALPGDPKTLGELAGHLSHLGAAADKAASGFTGIDTGNWHGQAAEGFRGYLDTSPPRWRTASDALTAAGQAVQRYAQVLAESQRQAAQAQQQLAEADHRSQQAQQTHQAAVGAHNAHVDTANAGGPPPGPAPGPFADPAAEQRAQAQNQLDRAREAVQHAGQDAARAVEHATAQAPGKPGWFSQVTTSITDSVQEQGRAIGGVLSGAGEAVGGMVQLVRTVNPMDPWNMAHPSQALHNANTMAAGMINVASDPAHYYQSAKTMADVDGWKNDPARAVGSCVPNAIASMAAGGGIAARVATGARRASRVGKAAEETSRAATGAEHVEQGEQRTAEAARASGQGAQWGRWPEPAAQRPNITASHAEPRNHVTPAAEQGHLQQPQHHAEQPWRPSSDPAPTSRGEHDFHEPAHGRDPVNPHSLRAPERLAHPGSEAAHHQPDLHHGHEPGHPPAREPQPHEHGDEPREHGTGEDHEHEHDQDHGHEPDHQPAHEEHHPDDPDSPQHHGHELAGPHGDPPLFDGTPMLDHYHGEQHGGVFEGPVRYLDEAQRQEYKMHVDDDGLLRTDDGRLFDTTNGYGHDGRGIFVMDKHGDIFASKFPIVGHFHHSSFLGGEPVGAAGELGVKDGKVQLISNISGHYQPTKTSTYDFIKHLYNDKGAFFDRDNLSVRWAKGSTY